MQTQSIEARLAALVAKPITHTVVTTYADGRTRQLGCRSRAAADNHRAMLAGKIGRKLIDRETGASVQVVSVEVEPAQ